MKLKVMPLLEVILKMEPIKMKYIPFNQNLNINEKRVINFLIYQTSYIYLNLSFSSEDFKILPKEENLPHSTSTDVIVGYRLLARNTF